MAELAGAAQPTTTVPKRKARAPSNAMRRMLAARFWLFQLAKELKHLAAPELLAQNRPLGLIHSGPSSLIMRLRARKTFGPPDGSTVMLCHCLVAAPPSPRITIFAVTTSVGQRIDVKPVATATFWEPSTA